MGRAARTNGVVRYRPSFDALGALLVPFQLPHWSQQHFLQFRCVLTQRWPIRLYVDLHTWDTTRPLTQHFDSPASAIYRPYQLYVLPLPCRRDSQSGGARALDGARCCIRFCHYRSYLGRFLVFCRIADSECPIHSERLARPGSTSRKEREKCGTPRLSVDVFWIGGRCGPPAPRLFSLHKTWPPFART